MGSDWPRAVMKVAILLLLLPFAWCWVGARVPWKRENFVAEVFDSGLKCHFFFTYVERHIAMKLSKVECPRPSSSKRDYFHGKVTSDSGTVFDIDMVNDKVKGAMLYRAALLVGGAK